MMRVSAPPFQGERAFQAGGEHFGVELAVISNVGVFEPAFLLDFLHAGGVSGEFVGGGVADFDFEFIGSGAGGFGYVPAEGGPGFRAQILGFAGGKITGKSPPSSGSE